MASLNPALDDARFCPRCGEPADIRFPARSRARTAATAPTTTPSRSRPRSRPTPTDVWLLRRAFDPGKGLWTFPGGFVDLGESVEQAASREVDEEMHIDVGLGELVGVYSRADERIVLIVFSAQALAVPQISEEATEVQGFAPHDIPWPELAFWSTEVALRDFLAR